LARVHAYVLFLDIVEYSLRTAPEQTEILEVLNGFVRELKKTINPKRLQLLPTGDGMAIVFLQEGNQQDLLSLPLSWACFIWTDLQTYNRNALEKDRFELRIGLHSQSVVPVLDVEDRRNVVGPGINFAQRIMDAALPGAILASTEYANELNSYSQEYRHLFRDEVLVHSKHLIQIRVRNVYGDFKGSIVGRREQPVDRPRVEMLPNDLRNSLLHAFNVFSKATHHDESGTSTFALSMLYAHQKRLSHLLQVKPAQPLNWRTVESKLSLFKLKGTHTYLELSSLIRPGLWQDEDWRKYQGHILAIAKETNCLARRLHIIKDEDLEIYQDELIPLMIAEFACMVRGRVLLVKDGQLIPITNDERYSLLKPKGANDMRRGYVFDDFCLLDCGTFYCSRARYQTILSDIQPYFELKGQEVSDQAKAFKVIDFTEGDEVQFMYEELRANFFRGWHNRKSTKTLHEIVKRLKPTEERIRGWIAASRRYLPEEDGNFPLENAVMAFFDERGRDGEDGRDLEDSLCIQLAATRRDHESDGHLPAVVVSEK